jgi:hypothetical protein
MILVSSNIRNYDLVWLVIISVACLFSSFQNKRLKLYMLVLVEDSVTFTSRSLWPRLAGLRLTVGGQSSYLGVGYRTTIAGSYEVSHQSDEYRSISCHLVSRFQSMRNSIRGHLYAVCNNLSCCDITKKCRIQGTSCLTIYFLRHKMLLLYTKFLYLYLTYCYHTIVILSTFYVT